MPNFVLDNEGKELSKDADQTAQQQRANERTDIFRHFSGSFHVVMCWNVNKCIVP